MKKILLLILAVFFAAGSFCLPAAAQEADFSGNLIRPQMLCQHTVSEALSWLDGKVGTSIDVDGAYGAQCVDVAMAYYDYLVGYHVQGNGADYADNELPAGWTRTYQGKAQAGDIIVSPDVAKPYGHVAVLGKNCVYEQEGGNGISTDVLHRRPTLLAQIDPAYDASMNWYIIRPDYKQEPLPVNTKPASGPMHRLYNPNSGEHFYTGNTEEKNHLAGIGWTYEGIGWTAPETGNEVYRLYNPNAGEHHYTLDAAERDMLVSVGWKYEGVGWLSAPKETGVPLYRQYNPNAFACNHNYTKSKEENDWLVSLGWKAEGIGWYGIA